MKVDKVVEIIHFSLFLYEWNICVFHDLYISDVLDSMFTCESAEYEDNKFIHRSCNTSQIKYKILCKMPKMLKKIEFVIQIDISNT